MAGLLQGFTAVNRAEEAGAPGAERTLEAREQHAIGSFERALALIQARNEVEAEAALRSLLEEQVVAECATDQLHRIKFLALKNLGDLLARRPGAAHEALAAYCQATEVVADDALLWNKLGTLAAETGCWAAARIAFERGLELDPRHPTMPDKLLSLLSHAGDTSAAGTLAAALLRQNPRHVGAAAVLARQQGRSAVGPTAAAVGAGLLQLPPAPVPPQPRKLRRTPLERPRSLEQPTWQQMLHTALLFLHSNRYVESGAAAAAAPHGSSPERKAVPSLARFQCRNHLAKQQQQQQQQQQQASPPGHGQALTQQASQQRPTQQQQQTEQPDGSGAAELGDPTAPQQHDAAMPSPDPEAAVSPAQAPAAGEAQQGADSGTVPPVAAPAGDTADAASPAAAEAAETATPMAASPLLSPESVQPDTGAASVQPAGVPQCSPASTPAGDEEQEQRHPNGRGRDNVEARATRSRAATGKDALPLGLATASGSQGQDYDDEALELLSTLGPLLSMPQHADAAAAALSPLLSSPAKAGLERLGGAGGDQQAAVAQEKEAQAVRAFVSNLPPQGIGRLELAAHLLRTLGTASSAAQLEPQVRLQLLQVAQYVQHDSLELSAEQCLVLGELHADAAAVTARKPAQPGSPSVAADAAPIGAAAIANAMRGSGAAQRSAPGRPRWGELNLAALQQGTALWLSRYRLAAAESPVGASPAGVPSDLGAEVLSAMEAFNGLARYWWATGRVLESRGEMPAASAAYANCSDALERQGSTAIVTLPHCQLDSCISLASVRAKQEALQLHTVLEAAGQSASSGDHAAVAAALAPVLLCCTDKEQQMLQLDQQQWLRGVHMLLTAAAHSHSWEVVLRCHLRLLNALLPAVPQPLLLLLQSGGEAGGSKAAADLHTAAAQLATEQLRPARGALDAAAAFLQQHGSHLLLAAMPSGSASGSGTPPKQQQVDLHAMERAMYEDVQRQVAFVVAACGAALAAAGPSAAESVLNLKVNERRATMCDAATILLCLDSLAARSDKTAAAAGAAAVLQSVERAQNVAWHLCDALGNAQALMERHGRFVQACMAGLQAQGLRLDALSNAPAAACQGSADDVPTAEELRAQLNGGLQHCLLWLFGLELPGLDKQEDWGGDFHVKSGADVAARHLASPKAVAGVWPLVEPYLLTDIEHVGKHRGFLQAAAEHFKELPAPLPALSKFAWRRLANVKPPHLPCAEVNIAAGEGGHREPMDRLLQLAAHAQPVQLHKDQGAAVPMTLDGALLEQAGAAEEPQLVAVRRSLYFLLSALQDTEPAVVDSLLEEGAEAVLEQQLWATKADLCYNPGRFASWEKLALDYHAVADALLMDASKAMTHREWRHSRDMPSRLSLWRRLAYWATAGAWLSASSSEERVRLLAQTGTRLLQDALRTLPCQDPLANRVAWHDVKSSSAYKDSCRLAEAAFDAAEAEMEGWEDAVGWDVLLARARCRRKQGQPAESWLPLMAQACHHAGRDDDGVLLPLYALHASRMRLLLNMPDAAQWSTGSKAQARRRKRRHASDTSSTDHERELLQLVGRYCFLPRDGQAAQAKDTAALREKWQRLLDDCCEAMRWCLDRNKSFHRAAYRLADAMLQTGQPRKAVALLAPLFSRAKQAFTHNMTAITESKVDSGAKRGRKPRQPGRRAQQQQEQETDVPAEEERAPPSVPECEWGCAPASLASVGMVEDDAAFGARLRKTLRLYFSSLADAAVAAANGQGPAEAEAGRQLPLDVLQQASAYISTLPPTANKAWDGCGKLARGHFLLALLGSLKVVCAPEQLQHVTGPPKPSPRLPAPASTAGGAIGMEVDGDEVEQQQQELAGQQTPAVALVAAASAPTGAVPTSAAMPPSAVQATPADVADTGTARKLWPALPTPATQGRQQLSAHQLQVAARLGGSSAEPLLAKAHQVFSDFSVHAEGEEKWGSLAAPSLLEAFKTSCSVVAGDEMLRQLCSQPDLLRRLFSLYATLYVHLLQHQGATDRLLALVQAMKKRVKGLVAAEPRQARFVRRQALVLSDALLGALEGSLAAVEHSLGSLAPSAEATGGGAQLGQDAMDADVPGPSTEAAHQQQEQQRQQAGTEAGQPAGQLSPPPVPGVPPAAAASPVPPGSAAQGMAVAQTPSVSAALPAGSTPGTDLRAMLGSPAPLLSAQQQQVQERCMELLQQVHCFQRDVCRWLQVVGAAASGGNLAAREETRALAAAGENLLLRAFRVHARCTGQPTMQELSQLSRAEQLKAADETAKQQRRQSRQQGGKQQQQQQGAAAGALPTIAEGSEEPAPAPAGRKRATAGQAETAVQSTRKRGRGAAPAVHPEAGQAQAQDQEDEEEEEAAAVQQVVAQALEAAVATDSAR